MCAAGDFQANVSNSERVPNGKSLLYSLNPGPVEDCSFTRPDDKVLLPSEGIGNADYSYFGDGFMKVDCGLTIHNVQDKDKDILDDLWTKHCGNAQCLRGQHKGLTL
jgi:hypothetical protein